MLKLTKCDMFCEFSTITSFCFDCPALMCSTCRDLMHRTSVEKGHEIINFNNSNTNWNCQLQFLNLFEDKVMAKNIFVEATRIFCEENFNKDYSDINNWTCLNCTAINSNTTKRCEICFHVSMERRNNLQNEYEGKVIHVHNNLLKNLVELDTISNISFENVLYQYMRHNNVKNFTITNWFKDIYLRDKCLSIVNNIVTNVGHNIEENQLAIEYDKYVQFENQRFFACFPNKKLLLSFGFQNLFDCSYVNKLNALPNKVCDKEITDEDIWKLINKDSKFTNHDVRILMTELNIEDKDKIVLLRDFINDEEMGKYLKDSFSDGRVQLIHIRQSLLEYLLIEDALPFLKKKCDLCFCEFPMPEIIVLIICNHQMCKTCVFGWLNEIIRNKFPCQWDCPSCLENELQQIDTNLYYFNLREILAEDKKLLELLENKLFQEQSMTNSNFHWCPNDECGFGFETDVEGAVKIRCTSCKTYLCINCNRMWKEQHEGKSCQEFELWMLREDPYLLNMIGIECPKCRMRYSLAAGGCLHFRCITCGVEFCGGCNQLMVKLCGKPGCEIRSLHGHHPRNCFYYLRDNDIKELEAMLEGHDYPKLEGKLNTSCPIVVCDKEFKESLCNENVHLTTGFCEKHYKEYLVEFINHFKIDPVDFADTTKMNQMLFQMVMPTLEIGEGEDENQFKISLMKEVKEKCLFYIPSSIKEKNINTSG